MAKIRYSDEFVCPKCGRHTALVCHADGTHQAHCMMCDAYYDVEIANVTNAARIRQMTDEELANAIVETYGVGAICPPNHTHIFCTLDNGCKSCWLDWLRKEAEDGRT